MTSLPLPIVAFFLATTLATLFAFTKANGGSKVALTGGILWLVAQSSIALTGFYLKADTIPPRVFLLAGAPPLALIAGLFATSAGRRFLDGFDLKWSVLLHSVRVLVEIALYVLFLHRQVAPAMTIENGNVDVLAGLTAPLVWWGYRKGRFGEGGLWAWNAVALLSLLNAVGRALLSAPFRFQRLSLGQPTVAILYFPFVLLLAFIVPVVLLCHLVVFRRAVLGERRTPEERPSLTREPGSAS